METMAGGVVDLGGSGVVVPDMGLGGWQWGDKGRWGFGTGYGPSEIADAFLGALEGRGRFFDTAEVYGHGTSEQVLGWMAARVPEPLVLATKFAPLPGRGGVRAVPEALRGSLRRLRRTVVDLYQVHWADRDEFDIEALMEVLAGCVRDGSVRLLGVSNFTAAEMLTADDALRARGHLPGEPPGALQPPAPRAGARRHPRGVPRAGGHAHRVQPAGAGRAHGSLRPRASPRPGRGRRLRCSMARCGPGCLPCST
jgi:aryl-alcohol dehydrogenase-like predicted oxidoreductase